MRPRLADADMLADQPPMDLRMECDGDLEIFYAPIDFINPSARLIIVGITPRRQQMTNSLIEYRRQRRLGRKEDELGPQVMKTVEQLDDLGTRQLDVDGNGVRLHGKANSLRLSFV